MGLRVLVGVEDGDSCGQAVLYCSTSGVALPWMFADGDAAERFVERHGDVRRLTEKEVEFLYNAFVKSEQAREARLEKKRPLSRQPSAASPKKRRT